MSDGQINYTAETWLGGRWIGHITGIRSVDVKSIGAGGGSIAWLDPGGLLRVGPQSAGADPGPACYGRGGTLPTVTDSAVVLGYIDPDYFLGGRLSLDVDAARRALAEHIAAPLGWSVEDAASAVLVIATENIVGAIREITIAQGIDPREVTIVAGGGASGLNIVPDRARAGVHAGPAAEHGRRSERLRRDVRRHHLRVLGQPLRRDPRARLRRSQRGAGDRRGSRRSLSARICKISTRLDPHRVPGGRSLPAAGLGARYPARGSRLESEADVRALEQTFHDTHRRVFAVDEPGQYLECLVWKSRATAVTAKPSVSARTVESADGDMEKHAPAYFRDAGLTETPMYSGGMLTPGTSVAGPAIIREPTTTVVVYPGSTATVTPLGNYLLEIGTDRRT